MLFIYVVKPLFLLASLGILAGCETLHDRHGHVMDETSFSFLSTQRTTQKEVLEKVGSPNCILPYDPHTWYYLSQGLQREAFFRPRSTDVLCYMLEFSPSGLLEKIYKSTQCIDLSPSSRAIRLPSSHGDTFLKQLLRNAGRQWPSVSVVRP